MEHSYLLIWKCWGYNILMKNPGVRTDFLLCLLNWSMSHIRYSKTLFRRPSWRHQISKHVKQLGKTIGMILLILICLVNLEISE